MATRAADDADFISSRMGAMRAERAALERAKDRGCHERAQGNSCGFAECPICHPEHWATRLNLKPEGGW